MQIKMAWRNYFCGCLLWGSPLCSPLTFRDRHIRCWNGRIQVTSWEVYDHQKRWNALHLFLNWKLTWTTMLYLPTTCSCSKGPYFLFLNFFLNTEKAGEYHVHFSTSRYVFPAPAKCSFLSLSRAPGLVLSFLASQLQWEAHLQVGLFA